MYSDKIAEIQKEVTAVLNDEYFGPETAPAAPPQTIIHPGMPPHHQPAPPPPAGAAAAEPNPGTASH
jgi:hypothetical protein